MINTGNLINKKITLLLPFCVMLLAGTAPVQNRTIENNQVTVYTTAENTEFRLTATDTLTLTEFGQPVERDACVFIDPTHRFQTFLGIGGAITDASAETLAKLPEEKQQQVMRSYFDAKEGIGYTLVRTHIHSCDFSPEMYNYIEEKDSTLKTFSIAHDEQFRIPMIKEAMKVAGGKITFYASPWSPPAWMKDNNNMLRGGKLLKKYYQSWANYYVKFIKAYEKAGVPVWGLTIQNEPMAAPRWESCVYTAEEEKDFLKNYLGPTLAKNGLGKKKIVIWDHNRNLMYQRASTILNDPAAAKYVWGTGFHWYSGDNFENVKRVAEAFPGKELLFTEGCAERFNKERINDWRWGEIYGRSMVHDFNNGAAGWTDWNILLDERGGPNHVRNFCYAPVHGNTETGELIYMNSFYYIGHFSKFIRPGAQRISCSSNRDQLLATAFQNTDGTIAVVVMNSSEDKINYRLWLNGKAVQVNSLPHSIATLVVK